MTAHVQVSRTPALLAGRAAEELVLECVSSAAGGGQDSDLAQATRLAFEALASLGLSGKQEELIWHGDTDLAMRVRDSSLAGEARMMLADAYARALLLIRSELALVDAVARELQNWGSINHAQIAELDSSRMVNEARRTLQELAALEPHTTILKG
jgi:cell division protease FtsH